MKRTTLSILFLLIAFCSHAQQKDSPESLARKFVEMLSRNEFAKAYATMDETMAAAINEEKLSLIWKQIQIQNGAYTHQKDASSETTSGYTTVMLTCGFEKSDLIVQLSYDPRGKVAGLYFKP